MPLITQGKTNIKYILIIVILTIVAAGGILIYSQVLIECYSAADCKPKKGHLYPACIGEWECVSNKCVWSCKGESVELVPSEVEGWKTYRSEDLGFEVGYPVDYFVSRTTDEVMFTHKKWKDVIFNHPYVSITIFETEYSLDEWVEQRIEERRKQGYGVYGDESCQMHCISAAAEEIRIGSNIRALQYEEWGVSAVGKHIVAEKGDGSNRLVVIYSHIAGGREPGERSVSGEILNKILSTFWFIETAEGFCGWSTQGVCASDADCIVGGCSGQVCQSESEESVVTTCEFKECYVAQNYGFSCKCVGNKCQWSK